MIAMDMDKKDEYCHYHYFYKQHSIPQCMNKSYKVINNGGGFIDVCKYHYDRWWKE